VENERASVDRQASLVRQGRIIWARTKSLTNLIGSPGSTIFTWQRPWLTARPCRRRSHVEILKRASGLL
jgi:hypothetical protein